MSELESISQLLDNLRFKLNINHITKSVTLAHIAAWNSKLFEVQRTLRELQNALVPVNQLPSEMLCRVFSTALEPTDHVIDTATRFLLNLTAVCQKWRYAAIANAGFWTNICVDFELPRTLTRASEFFIRSKTAPLSVSVTMGQASTYTADSCIIGSWMFELSRESHRLEKFHADVGLNFKAFETLDFPAPNLKSLSIACIVPACPVLPSIFNSQFPNLRKLKIRHFAFWPTSLFTNLTSLELSFLHGPGLSRSKFLDFLQGSPALSALRIDHYDPKGNDACHGRLIHLPYLQILELARCTETKFMLTHVVPSQSCDILLYNPLLLAIGNDILFVIPTEFTDGYFPQMIESLSVGFEEEKFQVKARQMLFSFTINQVLNLYHDPSFLRRSFDAIADYSPFTSITELIIHSNNSHNEDLFFSERLLESWFAQLDRLERLEWRLMSVYDMSKALLKEKAGGGLPCTKLRYLEIEVPEDPSADSLVLISDLVKGRYTGGLPIAQIDVKVGYPHEIEDWEYLWNKYVDTVHLKFSTEVDDAYSVVVR